MPSLNLPSSRFTTTLLTLVAIAAFCFSVRAQEAREVGLHSWQVPGVPDDWTHHHVVFSDPGREQDAIKNGTHEKWQKTVNDPRFVLQQLHRSTRWLYEQKLSGDDSSDRWTDRRDGGGQGPTMKRDWAATLGTAGHGSAGVYPAKYGASGTTASCADYVVFPTAVGSNGVPSIIAYNQIYSGCTTVPTQYWSANLTLTTHYSAVTTSPVVSIDGSQVAFIASISNGTTTSAYFVVLLMPTGNAALTSLACNTTTNVNNVSRTALPRAYCLKFANSNNDTASSPYYDYTTNVMYVGDALGVMHTFSNVFHTFEITGTRTNTTAPSEGTAVTVDAGQVLNSPVYDFVSGLILVTDQGGYLSSVGPTGTLARTARLTHGAGTNFKDAAVLDSSTEKVYLFAGEDELSTGCTTTPYCATVLQVSVPFTAGAGATAAAKVGAASTTVAFYDGSFDSTYYAGPGNTGYLYVCGNPGGNPTLYQIPMSGAFGSTVTSKGALTTAAATCSPITEVDTTASGDMIFLSVTANGLTTMGTNRCTGTTPACLYSYSVTGGTVAVADGFSVSAGTSGIVIDTIAAGGTTGSEEIYYEGLQAATCTVGTGVGGCAVQVSQGALR